METPAPQGAAANIIRPHRDGNGRFFNPWPHVQRTHPIAKLIKWLVFSKNAFRDIKRGRKAQFPALRPDLRALDASGKDYLVWLGHSTVLFKLASKTIITDPVFWDVNFLVRRKAPLPLDPAELPRIDYVLISHGHYDHLNTRTVKFLIKNHDPVFVTGPGYGRYLSSLGSRKNVALDWGETHGFDGVTVTALPIQHWSKRSLFDTNTMLWCSYLIEHAGKRCYWVADGAYYGGFAGIGERYGPIDIYLAPVGAYEPRWFMKDVHMNPEEALRSAMDVRARVFVPIHWGTFDLSDEPLWMPVERLREVYSAVTGAPELRILGHGGATSIGG